MSICSRKTQGSTSGTTLLELTTAVFVVSTGLLGISQMYRVCGDHTEIIHEQALAFQAVQGELEAWRAAAFTELTAGEHPFRTAAPALSHLCRADGNVHIEASPCGTPGLKQVRISLQWVTEHGRPAEKHLVALLAGKEPQI